MIKVYRDLLGDDRQVLRSQNHQAGTWRKVTPRRVVKLTIRPFIGRTIVRSQILQRTPCKPLPLKFCDFLQRASLDTKSAKKLGEFLPKFGKTFSPCTTVIQSRFIFLEMYKLFAKRCDSWKKLINTKISKSHN